MLLHPFSSWCKSTGTLTEARACLLLRHLGYQPNVLFTHLHAIRRSRTVTGRPCEDERHICCIEELATIDDTAFLMLVETVFTAKGYINAALLSE